MNSFKTLAVFFSGMLSFVFVYAQKDSSFQDEMYRPQFHFTPKEKWMNDPNGMVYKDGIYHLFYQYHPGSSVWGPMHWGHATSRDLLHWKRQPVKLFPDSIGTIFSGSAVVDKKNTAGFGKNALVAIFTQHNHAGEEAGTKDFQNQSIAYSLNNGKTWTKYAHNPVLRTPGIKDFRDPKVIWYEPSKKWIMTLAVVDRVYFYSSPDLKVWVKESEFGKDAGAHGGVWECPDLFPMEYEGTQQWVLIVSINPGGPNKGSATQYFVGQFDGKNFTPYSNDTQWIDYGPDNYAGVTWSNTGKRKIFIGWMSNWSYASHVPTETWRGAMTFPRELRLMKENNNWLVASLPVNELQKIKKEKRVIKNFRPEKPFDLSAISDFFSVPCMIKLSTEASDFTITLSNDAGDKLLLGFDKLANQFFLDRSHAGKTAFHQEFAATHIAPRLTGKPNLDITLLIDVTSIELFADEGLTVMTQIFFPRKPFDKMNISTKPGIGIKKIELNRLHSIWK
jgi:fructan beta-fructosidase